MPALVPFRSPVPGVPVTSVPTRLPAITLLPDPARITIPDRKSTRLNSSHLGTSYAVFCVKKKDVLLITLDSVDQGVVCIGRAWQGEFIVAGGRKPFSLLLRPPPYRARLPLVLSRLHRSAT